MTAWVASQLRAPSLRRLEVSRGEGAEDPSEPPLTLLSPGRAERVALRPVALRVRFVALYEDLSRILARIEGPGSAFEIRRIELQRKVPEVQVELRLDVWTRDSEGEVPS